MARVAVIAALPAELRPLVRAWGAEPGPEPGLWRRRFGADEWVASWAGAGAAAAGRALAAVERLGTVDAVVSVGWAGSLDPAYLPGRAYRVAEVADAGTGERFRCAGPGKGCLLVTSPAVAGREGKARLAREYGAQLVDMEAAALARGAARKGIPFSCVKGVSDGAGDDLPDFNRFLGADGRFRLAAFIGAGLARPRTWPLLARLGLHSRAAARDIVRVLGKPGPAGPGPRVGA